MDVGVLKHSKLNRKTAPPEHAWNHASYITRWPECDYVMGINFSSQRSEFVRQAMKQAQGVTRKNGVLCEKIMVTLPRCLSRKERLKTVNRYIWALSGQGRGRVAACFHKGNSDTNPHVHIYWYDKDQNGKSVWGASNKNSTIKLRQLWETTCNEMLQEFGHKQRIRMLRRTPEQILEQQEREYKLWKDARRAAELAYPSHYHMEAATALHPPEPPPATKRHRDAIEPQRSAADSEHIESPAIREDPMAYPQYKSGRDESLKSKIEDICQWDDELRRVLETKSAYAGILKEQARTIKELEAAQGQIDKLSLQLRQADIERGKAKASMDAIKVSFFARALSVVGYKTWASRRKADAREHLTIAEQTYATRQKDFRNTHLELQDLNHKRDNLKRDSELMVANIEAKWGHEEELVRSQKEMENTLVDLSKQVTGKQITEAHHKAHISDRQYQQALGVLNRYAETHQQEQKKDRDRSISR